METWAEISLGRGNSRGKGSPGADRKLASSKDGEKVRSVNGVREGKGGGRIRQGQDEWF